MSPATAVRVARRRGIRRAPSPKRREADAEVLRYGELTGRQRRLLHRDFRREILPALTPMALGPGHPFPRISSRSVSLAVMLKEPGRDERFGSLTLPEMFPRRWRIPGQPESGKFVWLEEMVAANVDLLFPGLEIVSASPFRITRAPRAGAEKNGAANRRPSARRRDRRRAETSLRLEVEHSMPRRARELLIRNLGISHDKAVAVDGPF